MIAPDYLYPVNKRPARELVTVPVVRATDSSVKGFGCLVDDPEQCDIEIVRWPAQGWRPVDEDSGDEAGSVEGIFQGEWKGDVLYGSNGAVGGHYILGWSNPEPAAVSEEEATVARSRVILWHLNYHPDGGQLFFPRTAEPFVVPVALPGDDLKPENVIAFWCDGSRGLYIHPGIWHEGIFPVTDRQEFLDRQGRVHARVSCDLGEEFGIYLSVPLRSSPPGAPG
jgi:hypothetical protein